MKIIVLLCLCSLSISVPAQTQTTSFHSPDGTFQIDYPTMLVHCTEQKHEENFSGTFYKRGCQVKSLHPSREAFVFLGIQPLLAASILFRRVEFVSPRISGSSLP